MQDKYVHETGIIEWSLRGRFRRPQPGIHQLQYKKLKEEKHLQSCDKGNTLILLLLRLRTYDRDIWREYKDHFIKKFKIKLNTW